MTSGNVSTTFDSYNKSSRVWSGSDTPKGQRRTEHNYTLNRSFTEAKKFYSAFWDGTKWIDPKWEYYSGTTGNATLLSWDASPNLVLNTWNKLAMQIKGNSFNTGVFLSQLPQAIDQLVAITGSLFMGFRSLRYGDVRGALRSFARASGTNALPARVTGRTRQGRFSRDRVDRLNQMLNSNLSKLKTQDVSATWLAMQYGVLPTLADVEDLVEFIASYHEHRKVVVKASKRFESKDTVWWGSNSSPRLDRIRTLGCSLRASLVENPPSNSWLGQFDAASVAWEVLPWSFVIDWLLPVGTFLETTAILRGLTINVTRSTIRTANSKGRGLRVNGISGGTGRVWSNGSVYEDNVEFIRAINVPVISPLPAMEVWKKAFSVGHLENAAALFAQQVHNFHR